MADWLVTTLRAYPQLAVFLALAIGFVIGPLKVKGFSLGNVTATLLAGVLIGQLGIQISPDVKNTFFILFLFAVGFGVGPQFVRGLAADGPKQVAFALIVLILCLIVPYVCALLAGLPLGYGAGLYAGSQTISAAIGVATDQINALNLPAEDSKRYIDQIPIAYAVTYIWGTIGSAIILAQLGPKLLGIDLPAACREYEKKLGGGGTSTEPGIASAYRRFSGHAYRIDAASSLTGRPVREIFPGIRIFVERVRRGDQIIEADADTVLSPGDIVVFSGSSSALVENVDPILKRVDDSELLDVEAEAVDVFIANKAVAGKTMGQLGDEPWARGVYARKIVRALVEIPVLPGTTAERGDIVTLVGSRRHVEDAIKVLGFADRPVETTDIAYIGGGILVGGLIGALTWRAGGIPLSLSTSGGALLAGLVLGWLRAIYPAFGRIPAPSLWLMNTLGLNIFIAVVGISAGPGFVAGMQEVGISLFLWGIAATSIPMLASVYIGHYIFKFHPAILFGACAGVRTTTAALGMIQEAAKSKIPALGYGMPYAVGNTLLTIFGLVIVLFSHPEASKLGYPGNMGEFTMEDANIYAKFEDLSPFEIKDELIRLAQADKSAHTYLNAGRGNPNWTATRAREAFFLLGFFALTEARRSYDDGEAGLAGMPPRDGCYKRLKQWLKKREGDDETPGAEALGAAVDFAIHKFSFEPDAFVHELTDSIIGDNYPVPDRSLKHNEAITHEYLMWAMCAGHRPDVKFDLYPVEGGTAAMCYIFKALKNQRLLNAGDTIAIGTPIFTPYIEMPQLEDYDLKMIRVSSKQEEHFQLTDADLEALADKKVKALFLVNPGNPSAVALRPETIQRLVDFVNKRRPDLMILTDDVYGTFVPDFQSVLGHLPRNTIGVYSYSKYFGCTGWRLGVIAVAQDNIFDEMIRKHPEPIQKKLQARYLAMTPKPREVKFIDRIVADSRDVALNHTAGLSLPQQVMMSLFGLVEMMDEAKVYQKACMAICEKRFRKLIAGMGIDVEVGPHFDRYYGIIDFEFFLRKHVGEDVVTWVKDNIHPLDIPFKLAQDHGIVLLNGSGFDAPNWSARVSFANLNDDAYEAIGRAVRAVARGYVQAHRASKGEPVQQ